MINDNDIDNHGDNDNDDNKTNNNDEFILSPLN